jgi:hypothetical protein
MRLFENGSYAKYLDIFDLKVGADINRELSTELKEELYFSIDEKCHQIDLSEIDHTTLYRQDLDAWCHRGLFPWKGIYRSGD